MSGSPRQFVLAADTVVAADALYRPGWIAISGDRVASFGEGRPPSAPDAVRNGCTIVPGFVDLHVHGGGGATFGADQTENRRAIAAHRAHGTTTMLASLVSAGAEELLQATGVLSPLADEGVIAGVHLEGPWLSAARAGAHQVDVLRDPEPAEFDALIRAGRGALRMVTLAPERTGAADAIRRLVGSGVVAAIGHTDASYDVTRHAIDAGATVATHLFNGMRPMHHRDPGPSVALIEDDRVALELVLDGVHVHPALYRTVAAATAPQRIALVTDAMAAAGRSDGSYGLGAAAIEVSGGVAPLAGRDTIAGSTATMDRIFRNAFAYGGANDAALLTAVRQTSTNPARALGLAGHDLSVGGRADLVVLDDTLRPIGVMVGGAWSGTEHTR